MFKMKEDRSSLDSDDEEICIRIAVIEIVQVDDVQNLIRFDYNIPCLFYRAFPSIDTGSWPRTRTRPGAQAAPSQAVNSGTDVGHFNLFKGRDGALLVCSTWAMHSDIAGFQSLPSMSALNHMRWNKRAYTLIGIDTKCRWRFEEFYFEAKLSFVSLWAGLYSVSMHFSAHLEWFWIVQVYLVKDICAFPRKVNEPVNGKFSSRSHNIALEWAWSWDAKKKRKKGLDMEGRSHRLTVNIKINPLWVASLSRLCCQDFEIRVNPKSR